MEKPLIRLTPAKVSIAVAIICLLVYLPVIFCGFVNYDDPDYVLNNPLIRTLDRNMFADAFTRSHIGWWMPLTWISLAVDYHFWGLNPFGYHLTNVLLHAANAGLVVLIAGRLLQGASRGERHGDSLYPLTLLLAGLLWGIHPLRVESVAWVTERKDVLNGLFSLGTIFLYFRYADKKENNGSGTREYMFSLVLFGLSLMAKSASVVLPALLLLADWYPLRRLQQGRGASLLLEKIPFLVLSLLMTTITFYSTAQSSYLVSYDFFPFSERLIVSGNAVFEYCRFLIWPTGIIPLHIIPDPIPSGYAVKAAAVVTVFVCVYMVRSTVYLPAVWLSFVILLLPVLAFFQNGDQSFAARFTYLPSVVPSIAAASAFTGVYLKVKGAGGHYQRLVVVVIAGYLAFYAGMTERLVGVWKDSETFWSRSISVEPSAILLKERGKLYFSQGKYAAAVNDFSAALPLATGNLKENIFNLYAFRGEVLRTSGRNEEAIADFTTAIALFPHPVYYRLRGLALKSIGRLQEAEEDFRRAGDETGPIGWYERGTR